MQPCLSGSVRREKGWTYTISKAKHLIAFLPFFPVKALEPLLRHRNDLARELDAHDRLGCLRGQRVLALSLHDVHSVETECADLTTEKDVGAVSGMNERGESAP